MRLIFRYKYCRAYSDPILDTRRPDWSERSPQGQRASFFAPPNRNEYPLQIKTLLLAMDLAISGSQVLARSLEPAYHTRPNRRIDVLCRFRPWRPLFGLTHCTANLTNRALTSRRIGIPRNDKSPNSVAESSLWSIDIGKLKAHLFLVRSPEKLK